MIVPRSFIVEAKDDVAIGEGKFCVRMSLEQLQLVTSYLCWTEPPFPDSGVFKQPAQDLLTLIENKMGWFFVDNAINEVDLAIAELDKTGKVKIFQNDVTILVK